MTFCTKAQNLVPNPSFEEYDQCPNNHGQLLPPYVEDWSDPTGATSDYFNACANPNPVVGVPYNNFGFQFARTGNAYAGIYLFLDSVTPQAAHIREYIEVELIEPLQVDTSYCVNFFVSLGGGIQMTATSSIVARFTTSYLTGLPGDTLEYGLQFANDPANLLLDTAGWMSVTGQIMSQGGEKFLTIGNFLSNSQTVLVNDTQSWPTNFAYYYIDDVSVMKCSQWNSVNDLVEKEKGLNVYPNPANDVVTVDFDFNNSANYRVELTDLVERVVFDDVRISTAHTINVSSLVNGVYVLHLTQDSKPIANTKLVVLR